MLEEHLHQFLEHLRYERNVSQHTLRNYSSDLDQFREHLAKIGALNIKIDEIDHLTIREWLASLHSLNKKKTSIARKLASLRTFFQFLVREGVLENNPAKAGCNSENRTEIANSSFDGRCCPLYRNA